MNPNLHERHFLLVASGLFLRPGRKGNSTLGHGLRPRTPSRVTDPPPSNPPENKSPYPGIIIGCGNELLDFRFEATEILQEREE
jgi:hypothetical protein